MQSTMIKYFAFAHLPLHLQAVSRQIGELADLFEQQLPAGPEKSAGMRKLLEAKDCFVRATLEDSKKAAATSAPESNQPQTNAATDGPVELLRQITTLLQRQIELMESSRDDHRESMARYDAMTASYQAFAVEPVLIEGESKTAITFTFEQFVQYGRDNGGNIVGGMPWSFSFHGHRVSHENDQCYLIGVNDGQVSFTPDYVLVLNPDGTLTTLRAEAQAL